MKWLATAILILCLWASPAAAESDELDFQQAEAVASAVVFDVYRSYLGVAAFEPIEIDYTAVSWQWVGSYGDSCPGWENFWVVTREAYNCYKDPKFIRTIKIYINLPGVRMIAKRQNIPVQKVLTYVLAHELGHHLLTLIGRDIWDQHEWMDSGPDQEMAKLLGVKYW